jgi:hypothetical protein
MAKKNNNKKTIKADKPAKIYAQPRNYTKTIILLILIFIVGAYITAIFYINYTVLYYKEIDTSVLITEHSAGLNADKGHLRFGKNFPGGWARRSFNLTVSQPSIVKIIVAGNISDFMGFSENNFLLEPNLIKNIDVEISIPLNASLGNYTGKIKVYILRP